MACGSLGGGPIGEAALSDESRRLQATLASVLGRAGGGSLVESGHGAVLRCVRSGGSPFSCCLCRRSGGLRLQAPVVVSPGGVLWVRGKPWPVRPARRRQRPRALLSSMGAQPRSPASTPTHPARVKTLYPLGFGGGGALRVVTLLEAPLGRRDAVGRRCR